MPWSKTGAEWGIFHLSKNNLRPGQNLVLEIDWIGSYFGPGQIVQNNPRPGLYGASFTSQYQIKIKSNNLFSQTQEYEVNDTTYVQYEENTKSIHRFTFYFIIRLLK